MPIQTQLDESLEDLALMLKAAYPEGVDNTEYHPLLALLYEHLSDRNLAAVISHLTNKDADIVLNEIYESLSTKKPNEKDIESIKTKLEPYGFSKVFCDD